MYAGLEPGEGGSALHTTIVDMLDIGCNIVVFLVGYQCPVCHEDQMIDSFTVGTHTPNNIHIWHMSGQIATYYQALQMTCITHAAKWSRKFLSGVVLKECKSNVKLWNIHNHELHNRASDVDVI